MKLRVGYELWYECLQPTPMMLTLNTHFSHAKDVVVADVLVTDPPLPIRQYRDLFGNLCSRIEAPVGRVALSTTALLNVSDSKEILTAGIVLTHCLRKVTARSAEFALRSSELFQQQVCKTGIGRRDAHRILKALVMNEHDFFLWRGAFAIRATLRIW